MLHDFSISLSVYPIFLRVHGRGGKSPKKCQAEVSETDQALYVTAPTSFWDSVSENPGFSSPSALRCYLCYTVEITRFKI